MADFTRQHLLLSLQLPEGVLVVAAFVQDFADLFQRKLEAAQRGDDFRGFQIPLIVRAVIRGRVDRRRDEQAEFVIEPQRANRDAADGRKLSDAKHGFARSGLAYGLQRLEGQEGS